MCAPARCACWRCWRRSAPRRRPTRRPSRGAGRARAAPDTPTVAEAGVPGYAVPDTWIGLVGPARLPEAIVNQVNAAVLKALGFADVLSRLEAAGFGVRGHTPEEFA